MIRTVAVYPFACAYLALLPLIARQQLAERDIRDFESDDLLGMRIDTEAIRQVLEDAGVEFIAVSSGGAGVRLRKR